MIFDFAAAAAVLAAFAALIIGFRFVDFIVCIFFDQSYLEELPRNTISIRFLSGFSIMTYTIEFWTFHNVSPITCTTLDDDFAVRLVNS